MRRSPSRSRAPRGRRWPTVLALLFLAGLVAFGLLDPRNLPGSLGELILGPSRNSADLSGPVTHVRDGDTIEVAGTPVRIANLDCAEMDSDDGQRARLFMVDLVRGESVACDLEGRMSHDREVGTCALAETGEDLGEILIGEGVCRRWE